MSGVSLSPETMSGPLYVTSEKSKPKPLQVDVPITGAMYVQGPIQMGSDGEFPSIYATLMVGPLSNNQTSDPAVPGALCTGDNNPYSLCVSGNAAIFDNLDVAQNIGAAGDIVTGKLPIKIGRAHV